jgi:predicted secreted protein
MIKLNNKNNNSQIFAKHGEKITIKLNENPTTGYTWVVKHLDTQNLELIDSVYKIKHNEIGAAGTRIFNFNVTNSGDSILTLQLKNQWEKDVIDDFTISISIS